MIGYFWLGTAGPRHPVATEVPYLAVISAGTANVWTLRGRVEAPAATGRHWPYLLCMVSLWDSATQSV